ncbi:cupin domain-containing protein [Sciscionella marina]|uniref:cupin domain-containing protein n=1 Tax=Sciscionella marina TaxID=508770 RepID=UPI000363A8CA|nr:cupin domain-containing protein [Sciscionella marina]
MPEPTDYIRYLELQPLPIEGGLFGESWRSADGSAIYYLLVAPAYSAPHRLDRTEVWVHHAGAPAAMLLLHPDGTIERVVLGTDVSAGERPQVVVPAGTWQTTVTRGEWSLFSTIVIPAYTDDCVEFASADKLAEQYPEAAAELHALRAPAD